MKTLSRRWKVALIASASVSILLFLVAEYFRLFGGGLPTSRIEAALASFVIFFVSLPGWHRVFSAYDAAADHELHENYSRAKELQRAKDQHDKH